MKTIAALILSFIVSLPSMAESLTIRYDGLGPVSVGMTAKEVGNALGLKLSQLPEAHDEECAYLVPIKGLKGVLFMFSHGRVVRIDVESGKTQTESGVRIGDSLTKIMKIYKRGVTVTPHQYIPEPQGKYVTVKAPDGKTGIRFEIDNGLVVAFYSGLFPQVTYVERCL